MDEKEKREKFDTGLSKIKHEIKDRLAAHGFYGSVKQADLEAADQVPTGSKIEVAVKGRTVGRSFSRQDIESSSNMTMITSRTRPPTPIWQHSPSCRLNDLPTVLPLTATSIFEPVGT